jgi:hypothetical protein
MTDNLIAELRDHEGNGHRDGYLCVRCRAATRIEELTTHGPVVASTADLIERATETLCGWDRCGDCMVLRETINEISRLRGETFKLARLLMSELVFVHETQIAMVDEALAAYLGVVHP